MKFAIVFLAIVAVAIAVPVLYETNGHYYEIVEAPGTWDDARADALSRSHLGKSGYLATLTCYNEWKFIVSLLRDVSSDAYLGGSDAAEPGTWIWVDGPEQGQQFTQAGQCLPDTFCAWSQGEPTGEYDGVPEHALMSWNINKWNDIPGDTVVGYAVVEYGDSVDTDPTCWRNIPVLNPANGHYYEIVESDQTWGDARADALARSYNGMSGYLATVTTQSEWDFILALIQEQESGEAWLGGSDADEPDKWIWVDGPEQGQQFADASGCLSGQFCAWYDGEPSGGDEDSLMSWNGDFWNDGNGFSPNGFAVVEYGGIDPVCATCKASVQNRVCTVMPHVSGC
eukprot:TRINITY_DN269_c0_g1_i1.p1 TRINITY_DN269_c0_g1~~TRINITY_DN269_c0_g1_i1.p1  ORF type:complete len:341 (-),score=50.71 TRINITY_DN269_c0_g1_i1:180-1202(-)